MTDVGVAVLSTDGVGPGLYSRPFDLDGRATDTTDQVVVVVGRDALAIDSLALLGPQHVHGTDLGEGRKGAIDRGQTDLFAGAGEQFVDLLG